MQYPQTKCGWPNLRENKIKILLLDIETAPNTAHVWGLWQQNVGLPQLLESSYVLCWSAKWLGQKEVMFDSVYQSKPKDMLRRIHSLLNDADAVIHFNGKKFDIPTLNKEFVLAGLKPPSPFHQIDLYMVVRNEFKFPSNRLDYVAQALKVGQKHKHEGHEMWIKCMANDKAAWKEMEKYNKQDVLILEKVYDKLLPWIKGHANYSVYKGQECCPNCGSVALIKRGFFYTAALQYQRYVCSDCGKWSRSNRTTSVRGARKNLSI